MSMRRTTGVLSREPARTGQERALHVREVASAREVRDFIALPYRLHRDNPLSRPGLRRTMRRKMNPRTNPLHREAQITHFVAYWGGEPVGRISASIDNEYVRRYGDYGFFGYFESIPQAAIATALLDHAEAWVKARGMAKIAGPYSYSSREEVGFLVSGHDTATPLMQPYNPPYYPELVEDAGYQKKFETVSYHWNANSDPQAQWRLIKRADDVLGFQKLTVRSARLDRYREELELVRWIYNDSFAHHPENVPLSRQVFTDMAEDLRPILDPNIVRIIESDEKPVGFLFMVPDLNEIISKSGRITPSFALRLATRRGGRIRGVRTAVVVLIGATQTQFGAGIGRALAGEIVRAAAQGGYSSVATTWVHEDNAWSKALVAQMGMPPQHQHRVYQKVL